MANALISLIISALLPLLLCTYGGQLLVHGEDHRFQVVRADSLMPADVCSTPEARGRNSLKIVHRHGPCSPSGTKPDHLQILAQDKLRVASLQARMSNASGGDATLQQGSKVSVPVQSGISLDISDYVVTLGFGTPKKDQTVFFDTGADVSWIQCEPCAGSCYPQRGPIFDPSASSTYNYTSCSSTVCTNLPSSFCYDGSCIYELRYGSDSKTFGFLASETLTLTPTDVFPGFVFGCAEDTHGNFGMVAGVVGFGRGSYSLASQMAGRLENAFAFSYCLPITSSTAGQLILGRTSNPSALYTPMLTRVGPVPSLYFIDLIGISVGGTRLPVSPVVFRGAGTVIDSGTVISRLHPSVYAAMRSAFRSGMSQYPLAKPADILDTCYNFSNAGDSVTYPAITFHYNGVGVTLGSVGVFYVIDVSQVCLAFASSDTGHANIVGNFQQRGFEIIYDIGAEKIGFAVPPAADLTTYGAFEVRPSPLV